MRLRAARVEDEGSVKKETPMRVTHFLVAAALLLTPGAPAMAAGKAGGLAAGGRTVAGPGSLQLAMGAQERVHEDPTMNRDVCVTLVNTGSSQLTLTLTGDTTPSTTVNQGVTKALCVANVHFVDVSCTGTNACNAQWRVDQD
jgi:hypothetical protein